MSYNFSSQSVHSSLSNVSKKIVARARVSWKSVAQKPVKQKFLEDCHARLLRKSLPQMCGASASRKSVLQECHAPEYQTRMS